MKNAPEKIAVGFYNDTYLFDQNACTAPHLIIWLGNDENIEIAKEYFGIIFTKWLNQIWCTTSYCR